MSRPKVVWPDRMNPTDSLFWLMDKIPEMRSTIGALALLDRAPTRAQLRAEYQRFVEHLPRMRQRVVEVPFGLAPPEWVEDEQFDLDFHVRYLAVPAPGGLDELLAELSPLYATALDRDRPLWEAYVCEGLNDGRGAVFLKMHHCLTDGVGGARMFAELLGQHSPADARHSKRGRAARSTSTAAMLWRAAQYNLEEAVQTGNAVAVALADAIRHPLATLGGLGRGIGTLAGFGSELVVARADSPLHAKRSLSRQLATFEMSLDEINAARAPLNATVNDIVLTMVSGALHRWHTSRGAEVHELRALVPVNLRGDDDAHAGNRLALLAVRLPTGEPSPLRRLRTIQDRMGHVKHDRRATLYPVLARVMTALPIAVAVQLSRQQTSRTNFVCTNVPGPPHVCYLAGATIERIFPYAPLVGDHPMAIALHSYRNLLCVGLDVDSMAMDDLPHFLDALREAYAETLNMAPQRTVRQRSSQHPQAARPARSA